jgi:hypothetical protein
MPEPESEADYRLRQIWDSNSESVLKYCEELMWYQLSSTMEQGVSEQTYRHIDKWSQSGIDKDRLLSHRWVV